MQTICVPDSFRIKNDLREITVKPVKAIFENYKIVLTCEIYVGEGIVPAFKKCFNIPVDPDPEIEKNLMAWNRYVQLMANEYFAAVVPLVIGEYFPEPSPLHPQLRQTVLNSEPHLFPL